MFFALSKKIISLPKFGRILFFFILLCSFTAILLFSHLLLLKKQLQEHEYKAVTLVLHEYLQKKIDGTYSTAHFSAHPPPNNLDFIRFVLGETQLLITGEKKFSFSGLVNLPPSANGYWVDLQSPGEGGNWILVSIPLENGGFIQGGKDVTSDGIAVYKQAVSSSILIFLLSSLACLALSCLIVHLMESPLRELEAILELALEQKKFTIPQTRGVLNPLHKLLEKIFSQNRKLIAEIQSSLDNVAHDLRTPMTRLRAVAEYTLQSDQDNPQPYRNALSDCLEESERVLAMLGVMMSVAEAEAGTMRLELQPLNVLETLQDVQGLYQYVAEDAGITVSVEGEADLFIQADKTRLSQVWANLLDNAIKYGHESGSVRIYFTKQEQTLSVCFCDDGIGISESEMSRIWERLYRGDRSRTQQGLGLGLNYVKAVVEAHGGSVFVTSTIQKGSCFEVCLPLQGEIAE